MNSEAARAATPKHLWLVGGLGLLWNSMGALDYTMTKLGNQAYLKDVPPEVLAAVAGFPAWATAAWAVGVWGSFLGSALLLLRSRHALSAFLASLAGLAVNTYSLHLGGLPTFSALGAMIWGVLLVMIWYSARQKAAGVLR
jgi:hypothetical protein